MANVRAIRSVSTSLVEYLSASFPGPPNEFDNINPTFRLLSSSDLADPNLSVSSPAITLYLYRVSVNDHLRNTRPSHDVSGTIPLPVNLHYLLSVWSSSSEEEGLLLAWAMRHFHQHPILDASLLTPEADWAPNEIVHIAPEEMSNEDLMRLWDTVALTYRLSYSYVARVVLLESDVIADVLPVIARRFQYGDQVGGAE